MNAAFWNGKRVFLTGHTGFKGGWLALWLARLGAKVSGYALAPNTSPSLFDLAGVLRAVSKSTIADLRDRATLAAAMNACDPEIVFHMAAQPLVRDSYEDPVGTYATNLLGTVHLLDAARAQANLKAILVITTDKCYENREWLWGYRENDRLGGHDPYSNSKACVELAVDSFRKSFFKTRPGAAVASVRAGNVIGGGDWSKDRLVPDILRGALSRSGEVVLRNPEAVRPWQHVLDPLHGYLMLAEKLAAGDTDFDEGWNFGPPTDDVHAVREVAEAMVKALGAGRIVVNRDSKAPHEAGLLQLDCSKARARLGWKAKFDFARAIAATAAWYSAWQRGEDMKTVTEAQIADYEALE